MYFFKTIGSELQQQLHFVCITDENMFKQIETVFGSLNQWSNGFAEERDKDTTKLGINPHRPNN